MTLEKRKGIPSLKGYYIAKSGEKFRYDSMSELAIMMHLDNKKMKWIKNTKLRIPYLFENKNRNYIPDFIVNYIDFPSMIMEIKGSNDKPELPLKFEAAKKYCKENNMTFVVVSYKDVKELIDWNKVKEYHYKNV
jgi:hypothetical protein